MEKIEQSRMAALIKATQEKQVYLDKLRTIKYALMCRKCTPEEFVKFYNFLWVHLKDIN